MFQFSDFASEIEDVSRHNANNIYLGAESFAVSITSAALSSGQVFPNITVPHFEVRGERYRLVTNSQLVSFSPIVTDVDQWNAYSVENQGWIQESYDLRNDDRTPPPIPTKVFRRLDDGVTTVPEEGKQQYCPLWQESKAPSDTSVINFNLLSHPIFARIFEQMQDTRKPVLSEVFNPAELLGGGALLDTEELSSHPESILIQPVFDNFDNETRNLGGTVITVIPWDVYFNNTLHEGADGIICVLRNTCGDAFTYQIDGPHASYLGQGDLHDHSYDDLEHVVAFGVGVDISGAQTNDDQDNGRCMYSLHIYPSEPMEDEYHTNQPVIFTVVILAIFAFTSCVFVLYDYLVQRRQEKVHDAAVKSNAIVSSLFPAEIRDRLFQHNETPEQKSGKKKTAGKGSGTDTAAKFRLKSYLDNGQAETLSESATVDYDSKPIADLFPNTTVMFADIAGFTAWSSVREPSQVFTLLETLYRAFDLIAKRRKVFKVETVGDCYVAVTGLPEPRKDHAVIMARFARDCMAKMNDLSHQLEVTLGPDTGDLAMRFGLHSGPVTAGVLRGDKSRFQLFGDTVNTAARIESTGLRHRIHLSQETADLLKEAGKESWVAPRDGVVVAKGKGEMQTFWLLTKDGDVFAHTPDGVAIKSTRKTSQRQLVKNIIPAQMAVNPKIDRLVDWNVDVLKRLLKLIMAKRVAKYDPNYTPQIDEVAKTEGNILLKDGMALDEVVEIVELPKFDAKTQRSQPDPNTMEISSQVIQQLREFVENIACMYRQNSFHNFEHASHVTMSVSKLLSRIVAPDIDYEDEDVEASLHDHTYGITSDPLTQFAVVIAALIHDVDHVGVPNFILMQENQNLAATYKNKSIAEQNSVDLAWETLMEPRFSDLRNCIYGDVTELNRFRQLVVQTVLATDIFDKELQTLRKSRWVTAFKEDGNSSDTPEAVNRKATIVIEHLIQASDVAHTMQHWHIYQKWNERLFKEMYEAHKVGRGLNNIAPGWYQGELGFFDNYIIPLAKKLKDCGVFGVSSDEYLNYALENRREWAAKGEEVVAAMIEKYCDPEDKPDQSMVPESKPGEHKEEKPANTTPSK